MTLPAVANPGSLPRGDVPLLGIEEFRAAVLDACKTGWLAAYFGMQAGDRVEVLAVVAVPGRGKLLLVRTEVGDRYPALTPDCHQAHWFERELAEQFGVIPEGHPWLKPVRWAPPWNDRYAWGKDWLAEGPAVTRFFRVEGPEVHEVAVGPVHAGVIEPGHFRFQCHGEVVFHLEIALGYQHRGIEKLLLGGPNRRTPALIESMAGDTTVGHMTAYCQLVENLAGVRVPARAQSIRAIALELERQANHTGDLGALAQDVGFLPTSSYCGRLRGEFLNATADLCGNRFGRALLRPGGVLFDADPDRAKALADKVSAAVREVDGATSLMWNAASVQARFQDTGTVSRQTCLDLGIVGPAARASGVETDVRHDFPGGFYRFAQLPVSVCPSGDVFGRAYVRWLEVSRSGDFIREQLAALPKDATMAGGMGELRRDAIAVSLVEGWRGAICHVAVTDAAGKFARYKVIDPSFHNWIGLAMALRNQQVSDFPLCNKSFNLSYCGHDL
jgi:Ni,Fe-hydrogenase III large subunit/NADH:ubiquinone oxidoreductase subunit C